jgi:hypothetical protein
MKRLSRRIFAFPTGTMKFLRVLVVWFLGVYILSFFVVFNVFRETPNPCREFTDSGNRPVVGPAVSLVGCVLCKPRGPSFLWATDYTGHEWLFALYKPCIALWARLNPHCELILD